MRETVPSRTLLTYLVPSGRMARPSLPGSTAFSVFISLPAGENVNAEHHGSDDVLDFRSKASAKRQYQQLFLDFGQRNFAEQQFCPLCGMMVVHGVEEDIRQHEKICSDYKFGVPFHSDAARAVAHPRPDSVIYQVRKRS